MIDMSGCIAVCNLSEEEISAVADHEKIPFMAALELGDMLSQSQDGILTVKRMILDDIARAQRSGDFARSAKLKNTLKRFIEAHPDAREILVV